MKGYRRNGAIVVLGAMAFVGVIDAALRVEEAIGADWLTGESDNLGTILGAILAGVISAVVAILIVQKSIAPVWRQVDLMTAEHLSAVARKLEEQARLEDNSLRAIVKMSNSIADSARFVVRNRGAPVDVDDKEMFAKIYITPSGVINSMIKMNIEIGNEIKRLLEEARTSINLPGLSMARGKYISALSALSDLSNIVDAKQIAGGSLRDDEMFRVIERYISDHERVVYRCVQDSISYASNVQIEMGVVIKMSGDIHMRLLSKGG